MSYTAVVLPILAALQMAEQAFLGPDRVWKTVNTKQELFLKNYWPKKNELQALLFANPEEMKSCASKNIEEVNKFLADNGFTIQLEPLPKEVDGFAVASILNILLEWKNAGQETQLTIEGKTYPAVLLEEEDIFLKTRGGELNTDERKISPPVLVEKGYEILKTNKGELILAVKAKNGDTVYMTVASKPLDGFELIEKIQSLSQSVCTGVTKEFKHAVFPMVDLDHSMSLNWLLRLGTFAKNGHYYLINQALQQTRFQMNEKGAAAQSAVAISFIDSCYLPKPKPDFVIDKPFYLWIERKSMSLPLFAGYIDTADWKKPERLGR